MVQMKALQISFLASSRKCTDGNALGPNGGVPDGGNNCMLKGSVLGVPL